MTLDTLHDEAPAGGTAVDPVTFEVIRHRLWAINDDQAMIASRLSGSPVVYEAFDFNAALLTADGRNLFTGTYIVSHAATLDVFIQKVLADWAPEDIREGDMFFTNDPWSGALHANDGILAMPLFHDGRLVAWAAIVMHDQDVGSPVPGSFVVGASDRFGEAPLVPGVKLVEGYEVRRDIERMFLRNHRTPELNAMNLRARVAALKLTQERISGLIDEYGVDAFLASQEGILDYVERMMRARLRAIPDGTWFEQVVLDHDGVADRRYPIQVHLTKRGERLTLDFRGTAAQAGGPINCARPALEGASLGVFLTCLCYDVPWSVGAVRRLVDIVSEPGTVNDAVGDAPVSMASVMGTLITQNAVANAFGKMLQSSPEYREEAQACWSPGHVVGVFAGVHRTGDFFTALMMEALGAGGGARAFCDGIDSAGDFGSMSARIPNVEVTESRSPLLILYRRELTDSGGYGRHRGGTGLEYAVVPHKNPAPVHQILLASGVAQPVGNGLSGGVAAPARYSVVLRGSDVEQQFAAGRIPTAIEDIGAAEVEVQLAKAATEMDRGDVHVCHVGGGGGYGDPLRREPARVLADVREGLVSAPFAGEVYGVVLDGDGVDEAATGQRREAIRARRLQEATATGTLDDRRVEGGTVLHPVGDTVEAVSTEQGAVIRCTECLSVFCDYDQDFKRHALALDVGLESLSAANRFAPAGESFVRQFFCRGCGTAVAADVQLAGEEVLNECVFGDAAGRDAGAP